MKVYATSPKSLSFRAVGLPVWLAPCETPTKAGNPCKHRTMTGQYQCKHHGGHAPKNLAAGERRYIVWLLTGMPDYASLCQPLMPSFWTLIQKMTIMDETMTLKFASAMLDALTKADKPIQLVPKYHRPKVHASKLPQPDLPIRIPGTAQRLAMQQRKYRRRRTARANEAAAAAALALEQARPSVDQPTESAPVTQVILVE